MITRKQIEKTWGTPEQWKELCISIVDEFSDLIKRSNLEEVDGWIAKPDACGKPTFQRSGKTILVSIYSEQIEKQKTKFLQDLAAKGRALHKAETDLKTANERIAELLRNKMV